MIDNYSRRILSWMLEERLGIPVIEPVQAAVAMALGGVLVAGHAAGAAPGADAGR